MAVACSKRSYLQQIARLSGRGHKNRQIKEDEQFELPWKSFWKDADEAISEILVSHKQNNSVLTKVKKRLYDYHGNPKTDKHGNKLPPAEGMAARGQLHKETVYGKHEGKDGVEYFHINKPLENITSAQVSKIVDPEIRKQVENAILNANPKIDLKKSYKVPNNAFFKYDEETKKRKSLVFLPNRNGNSVPIKSVRIRETIGNAEQLKDGVNQYVNPRNNHHVLIYQNKKGNLAEQVVTFWEAVEQKKQYLPVVQLPSDGEEFISVLRENEMFLMNLSDIQIRDKIDEPSLLASHLYRVQKISSKDYTFRLVTETTLNNNIPPFYHRIRSLGKGKRGWQSFNPVNVAVSPIGELKLSNK